MNESREKIQARIDENDIMLKSIEGINARYATLLQRVMLKRIERVMKSRQNKLRIELEKEIEEEAKYYGAKG